MMNFPNVLPRSFYDRDPVTVGRELLGKLLLRELDGVVLVGRIVETEAYLATNDHASHAYRGRTKRNAAMFGPPGQSYVYAIHRYHCLNIVTEREDVASAVLIRAAEPLKGIEVMQMKRGTDHLTNLASGPGKLCQAFVIDRASDRWDVTAGQMLWVAASTSNAAIDVTTTTRVGVTSARHLPLRFHVSSSPFVSRGPRANSLNDESIL
jgi:DNA-3-methyladenine glycosylase